MKTNSRARCNLSVSRWASYALAGAATVVAANDAEGQILYSGTLNTPMSSSGPAFHTLISNGNQGAIQIGAFSHFAVNATSGITKVAMNGAVGAKAPGFFASQDETHLLFTYPANLPAGQKINSLNFNVAGGYLAGSTGYGRNMLASAAFRNAGIGYLAFEFDKGDGEQYGWVRVNMTTGTPQNAATVVDYAYGAVGQAITVGESVLPLPTWSGANSDNFADPANWSTGVVPGATSGTTNTDTAYFSQAFTNEPDVTDANRNLMNITFNMPSNQTVVLGAYGTNNPAMLLTEGGTIQIASTALGPATINVPLILEGTSGSTMNSYTFANNTNLPGSVTLVINSNISPAAANSVTTLNLAGISTANNYVDGVLSDGPGGAVLALNVQGGNWLLQAPAASDTFSGGTTIANGATLRVSGTVSVMSQSMDIVNSGSLYYSGGNQKVGKITGAGGSVSVTSGSLTAYQIRQSSLTIGSGATVALSPSGSGSTTNPAMPNNINFSSSLTSLSIASSGGVYTGTLDIGNNGLVIAYGNPANDPYTTIDKMIESGYNGGVWGGKGITSSLAQAGVAMNISTPLNIGLVDFTPGTGNYTNQTFIVFEGQTVTTNAILVRLTYMDDIVLAGDMAQNNSTSDALLFAANFGSGTTWAVGDLTHDGTIDSNDALLFAANFTVGLPSLDGTSGNAVAQGGSTAAVPEPASLGLLAIGAAGLLAVRRRRGRQERLSVGPLDSVELFSSDWEGPTVSPLIADHRSR